ncbi:unnamed protein product [Ceratitis capitata]|uniref:(Mediterranean fruit fly) hypothetical protein n=1 Tax=Ceratitis capitata TaxID=7213 RepID=A0A811UN06_CERCA|nr:unnamed protein product [Ceratitis capitata]
MLPRLLLRLRLRLFMFIGSGKLKETNCVKLIFDFYECYYYTQKQQQQQQQQQRQQYTTNDEPEEILERKTLHHLKKLRPTASFSRKSVQLNSVCFNQLPQTIQIGQHLAEVSTICRDKETVGVETHNSVVASG